jgi:ADP-ribose pyrophosphatase
MKQWRTNSRTVVLDQRPWLTVENHTVELPSGHTIPHWPWIVTPDFVNVVAIAEDDTFICFRQVKYGVEGDTLAIVGGFLNDGESPLAAAQRELREETGYEAGDWQALGSYRVDPNRGMGTGHFFLARKARFAGGHTADDLEEQQVLFLTRERVEQALMAGEFKALAWTAAVALALRSG